MATNTMMMGMMVVDTTVVGRMVAGMMVVGTMEHLRNNKLTNFEIYLVRSKRKHDLLLSHLSPVLPYLQLQPIPPFGN